VSGVDISQQLVSLVQHQKRAAVQPQHTHPADATPHGHMNVSAQHQYSDVQLLGVAAGAREGHKHTCDICVFVGHSRLDWA
jgi:hypothetical protein